MAIVGGQGRPQSLFSFRWLQARMTGQQRGARAIQADKLHVHAPRLHPANQFFQHACGRHVPDMGMRQVNRDMAGRVMQVECIGKAIG